MSRPVYFSSTFYEGMMWLHLYNTDKIIDRAVFFYSASPCLVSDRLQEWKEKYDFVDSGEGKSTIECYKQVIKEKRVCGD